MSDVRDSIAQRLATVVIMIGLPGSGKSTWIEQLRQHVERFALREQVERSVHVVSADSYFTDPVAGRYMFDPTRLRVAHEMCFRLYLDTIRNASATTVVVDNTNLTNVERAPYVLTARAYGYSVVFAHLDEWDADALAVRNKHGVSLVQLLRMHNRYEPISQLWQDDCTYVRIRGVQSTENELYFFDADDR